MINPGNDARFPTGARPSGFPPEVVARIGTASRHPSSRDHCPVIGLAGPPGSGKTTLAGQWRDWLKQHHRTGVVLSLDDFYLGLRRRRELAERIHPLLARRGVPGTHDLPALCRTLAALQRGQPVRWPRFDKTRDDTNGFHRHTGGRPDAVLVEGWCLGCRQLPADPGLPAAWRDHVNTAIRALRRDVESQFITLFLLRAPEPGCVPAWRYEQEIRPDVPLIHPTRRQINDFVAPMTPLFRDQLLNPRPGVQCIDLDHRRRPRNP